MLLTILQILYEAVSPIAAVFGIFFVLVLVHELGHFVAAKWLGVYAPLFSIGMGRPIWRRRVGETEYRIGWLPIGGFVRMASHRESDAMAKLEGGALKTEREGPVGSRPHAVEDDRPREPDASPGPAPGAAVRASGWKGAFARRHARAVRREQRERARAEARAARSGTASHDLLQPFGPRPIPAHRYLEAQPFSGQLLVMSAGVIANLLLGFFVLSGLAIAYGRAVTPTRVIGGVRAIPGAPAATARVRSLVAVGDSIQSVNGRPVENWNAIMAALENHATRDRGPDTVVLGTQRGTVRIAVGGGDGLTPATLRRALEPHFDPVIASVLQDSPASRAGLLAGDRVMAVDGEPVMSWPQVHRWIERGAGETLRISVLRAGQHHAVEVALDSAAERDPATGRTRTVGRLGVTLQPVAVRVPLSPPEALAAGARGTARVTTMVVGALGQLARGRMPLADLSGPLAIAQQTAGASRSGAMQLFGMLAFLSINIALFNLLVPIPVLDGGQIVLLCAEAVMGRALPGGVRDVIMRAGLAMMILLFGLVMVQDLGRLLE